MRVGMATMSWRFGCLRISRSPWSSLRSSAAVSNCRWAIRNGFSSSGTAAPGFSLTLGMGARPPCEWWMGCFAASGYLRAGLDRSVLRPASGRLLVSRPIRPSSCVRWYARLSIWIFRSTVASSTPSRHAQAHGHEIQNRPHARGRDVIEHCLARARGHGKDGDIDPFPSSRSSSSRSSGTRDSPPRRGRRPSRGSSRTAP